MQTCPACHFVSPFEDQFCRQCGSSFAAGSRSASNSDKVRWLLLFLFIMSIGIALGTLATRRQSSRRTARIVYEDSARLATLERPREAQESARARQEHQRVVVERVHEMSERAAESGAPPAPSNAKPLDLSPYEYPGAAIGNYSHIPGNEMVQMRSKDSFDAIVQHYQKKLGKPLTLMNDEDDKSAFFQSTAAPAVFVSIENDDDHDGFWKITITRAPFQSPQPEAPKPPTRPAKP